VGKRDKDLKLAILGGTFDPLHLGHIQIAQKACELLEIDRVDFVLAKTPPLKMSSVYLDAEKRYELLEEGLRPFKKLRPSRLELDRDGVSYSYLTIQDYQRIYPKAKLYWIMGSDAFSSIDQWKNYELLFKSLTFIIYPRPVNDSKINFRSSFSKDPETIVLEAESINISSSEIRELIKSQENPSNTLVRLDQLVPNNIKDRVLDFYYS
jgi:nicotinate-nucleotide adenylyltransferase